MSYPDLGCLSECLQCELCEHLLDQEDEPELELDPSDVVLDDQDPPVWADPDWAPEPAASRDEPITGAPLDHDWALQPTWDPYGLEFYGEL